MEAFASASALMASLSDGSTTSAALVEHYRSRIERFNPAINAVVATNWDAVADQARRADDERRAGRPRGPLHGLPMTVKDSWETTDFVTACGNPAWRDHRAAQDAVIVARLRAAGAIIMGKTNTPLLAMDLQSYNEVYGTTGNPWDTARTCGGSSGGAAAALAAGLTPVEFGSDIGGSLRNPAHYCGVFSHKTTWGLVPGQGHMPPPPGTLVDPDLGVFGPMACTAQDLDLLLGLTAGPLPQGDFPPYVLPAPQSVRLDELKLAYWSRDDFCPFEPVVEARIDESIARIGGAVQSLRPAWPAGLTMAGVHDLYTQLLTAEISGGLPDSAFTVMQAMAPWTHMLGWLGSAARGGRAAFISASTMTYRQHERLREARGRLAHAAHDFFLAHDALLMPVMPWTAHEHLHSGDITSRRLPSSAGQRPYADGLVWIGLATLLGLPATVVPIGCASDGLPVGLQIIGPRWQDRKTIAIARALEQAGLCGFAPPPGFS